MQESISLVGRAGVQSRLLSAFCGCHCDAIWQTEAVVSSHFSLPEKGRSPLSWQSAAQVSTRLHQRRPESYTSIELHPEMLLYRIKPQSWKDLGQSCTESTLSVRQHQQDVNVLQHWARTGAGPATAVPDVSCMDMVLCPSLP